ncbi:group II intron-encoded maturase [Acidobacterium capsulatum ATCC 51196]|uniref:Group II intron-encoded maturase n=2 Tax=Acidobacterium capsulatum TaxID=33075 RepID=C1F5Q2_ACIC5|nr:group II intron-encoded maturase [Acidobacterium capsulatum ATCC 51196]
MQPLRIVGGEEHSVGIDVGEVPLHHARVAFGGFGHRLAGLVQHIIGFISRALKAVRRRIAAPARDRPLGHAIPIRVVDVAHHRADPIHGSTLHRANAALRVIEILAALRIRSSISGLIIAGRTRARHLVVRVVLNHGLSTARRSPSRRARISRRRTLRIQTIAPLVVIPAIAGLGKPETFDFLGFTHICGKTKKGRFMVLRQTVRERMQAKLQEVKTELRRCPHDPVPEVGKWLKSIVGGHIRYFGVPGNRHALAHFRYTVSNLWHRALCRRSQHGRVKWERMKRLIRKWLPPAHICRPYPSRRLRVTT